MSTTIDSFYWKNHRAISAGLNAWLAIGYVYFVGVLMYTQPWGPNLGVASSPQRLMWQASVSIVMVLPHALWLMKYWIDHQEWVAEANGEEYEQGKIYDVFTTKRIIISAIGMALFGASGAFWTPMLDVPGLIWQFLAICYDPIVCWFGVTFGFALIRGPLFQGMWNPFQIIRVGICDAPMLMFVANIWWRYWRPNYLTGKMSLFRASIEYTILGLAIHYPTGGWTFFSSRILSPDPLFITSVIATGVNPWWWAQFGGFKFIGFHVGAQVGKYIWMKKPEYVILK